MGDSETADWEELAAELNAHGVPPVRAKAVALYARTDLTYEEVAERLGRESRGSVSNEIREFRQTVKDAEWLAENAPDV